MNGNIYATTDKGETWVKQSNESLEILSGIDCNNSGQSVAVGASGTVVQSPSGGGSWQKVNYGTSENLLKVFFVNNLIGFGVGEKGVIVKPGLCNRILNRCFKSTNLFENSIHPTPSFDW